MFLYFYCSQKKGRNVLEKEVPIAGVTLCELQELLGVKSVDDMIGVEWRVDEKMLRNISKYIPEILDPSKYIYRICIYLE